MHRTYCRRRLGSTLFQFVLSSLLFFLLGFDGEFTCVRVCAQSNVVVSFYCVHMGYCRVIRLNLLLGIAVAVVIVVCRHSPHHMEKELFFSASWKLFIIVASANDRNTQNRTLEPLENKLNLLFFSFFSLFFFLVDHACLYVCCTIRPMSLDATHAGTQNMIQFRFKRNGSDLNVQRRCRRHEATQNRGIRNRIKKNTIRMTRRRQTQLVFYLSQWRCTKRGWAMHRNAFSLHSTLRFTRFLAFEIRKWLKWTVCKCERTLSKCVHN